MPREELTVPTYDMYSVLYSSIVIPTAPLTTQYTHYTPVSTERKEKKEEAKKTNI